MAVFASGASTYFMAPAAPTGWVQVTTYNNIALRLVSGSTGNTVTSGIPFTSIHTPSLPFTGFANTTSGTICGTALTAPQIAAHTHNIPQNFALSGCNVNVYNAGPYTGTTRPGTPGPWSTNSTGCGTPHNHPLGVSFQLSSSINFSVNYIDVIQCYKT
jgi:hypothetical protein